MSPTTAQIYRACLSVGIALTFCAVPVSAQQTDAGEGPIIIDQPRGSGEGVHFDPGLFTLTLIGVYQHDKISAGGATSNTDQWIFSQQLGYETHGYILDPNFIDMDIKFAGGIEEDYVTTNGQSSSGVNPVDSWDLRATYLRNGEWPLTLYSTRQEGWIFRDFGSAIRTNTTVTGAALDHSEGPLTTHLDISRTTSNQTGNQDFDDLSYTQDRLSWFSVYRPSSNQTLTWTYNYADTRESGAVDNTYTTHDATLAHEAMFGENRQSSLTSTLNYSNYSGTSDVQRFRWDEHLALKHSDSFRTRYHTTADRTEIGASERTSYRGAAGFTHQFYKSLTTNGNIGASKSEDSQGGGSTERFADLSWAYRKAIPYGELSADLGFAWAHGENDASGDITTVNQFAVFSGAPPIVIIGANIDPNSIILRDPSGLLYRPGIDYTTRAFADRIEISRIIGGGIGDGQTVLIDYTRGAQDATTTDTNGLFTGIRYDFQKGPLSGLAFYARYAKQDQSISSENPDAFTPNSYTDILYGTEYRFRGLTVGAEKQWHDSTIFPYDATRYWGRYLVSERDTTWSLNAAYTTIRYPDENNVDDLYTLSARVEQRFNTHLTGDATVMWRDERNRLFGKSTGFEEQLGLRWRYREVTAYLQLRAAQLETQDQERRFEFVRVGVERKF